MRRSIEEICNLAERASEFDLDTEEGYLSLQEFAKKVGVNKDTLIYYSNAYEASGESGIRALTYKEKMPDTIREEATTRINKFFSKRLPRGEAEGKLWFQVVSEKNSIIVSERRPVFNDPSKSTTSPFVQFRYTDFDSQWHIYWQRASGKWWPYVPMKEIHSIDDCLTELEADPYHCFFG